MQFWSGTAFMQTSEALAVARMFDEAGYDGIVCSDHMIYPRELASPYPDSPTGKPMWSPDTAWPDSWVLIGAMAGVTRRVRFSNAVYVAPARPLLEVVKQVATASVVSKGRVSLAVGVGWMREEFELMGQDFDTRGKRLNEMIPALRARASPRVRTGERALRHPARAARPTDARSVQARRGHRHHPGDGCPMGRYGSAVGRC
jgi:alkanesulfonate monooxygenase SsuD/methylene tetrahydromethanopterin reductase-like flavin-dependent oxidoreductase (luciferase family)